MFCDCFKCRKCFERDDGVVWRIRIDRKCLFNDFCSFLSVILRDGRLCLGWSSMESSSTWRFLRCDCLFGCAISISVFSFSCCSDNRPK